MSAGGGFSITHQTVKEMEQSFLSEYDSDSIMLSRLYPNFQTLCDEIIESFQSINNLCKK